jgi:hypothetical protein
MAAAAVTGLLALPVTPVSAATFVVDVLSDNPADGYTLREAVFDAELAPGTDTITFLPGLSGTLTLGLQLDIHSSMQIVGPGSGRLTIDAGGTDRAFFSNTPGVILTLQGMTITNGHAGGSNGGGILFRDGFALILTDLVVSSNVAFGNGGGVEIANTAGGVTMTDVVIDDNTSWGIGAGLHADDIGGDVRLSRLTLSGNHTLVAGGGGGGFTNVAGKIDVADLTVRDNSAVEEIGGVLLESVGPINVAGAEVVNNESSADDYGGARFASPATVNVSNGTFTDNQAAGNFGGLYVNTSGTSAITSVEVDRNTALNAAGATMFASEARVTDSRFSNNQTIGDIGGLLTESATTTIERTTVSGNSASNSAV